MPGPWDVDQPQTGRPQETGPEPQQFGSALPERVNGWAQGTLA